MAGIDFSDALKTFLFRYWPLEKEGWLAVVFSSHRSAHGNVAVPRKLDRVANDIV
jgi:hypothetical protein